ncbi:hypothetical protein BX666DRAFT_1881211 [Dichotomocladium elegans]|nr:hypothetical protein BX666DRAFT_1881211 [Dichotomocladium elegans]
MAKRKRNNSFESHASVSVSKPPSAEQQQVPENRRPGRKPLHYRDQLDDDEEDPKVKRKVQNRAAQRAFRERKERYVRELETKIRQIEMNYMQVTSQLAQENQYLRLAVHRLKTELSTIKGIPYESMQDIVPALDQLQQQQQQQHQQQQLPQILPISPMQPHQPSADLAPFLTISSQSMGPSGPAPVTPVQPRMRALAPASRASVEKKRPVPILPHQHQHEQQQQQQRSSSETAHLYVAASSSSSSSSSASSSSSSVAAMYVRFSPQERPQDVFVASDTLRTDPYLTAQPLFEHYHGGNSSRPSGTKQADQVEKATTVVDDEESATTRMQTVWRRLNLYGRFAEFDFDQLCKVAQIADGNPAFQRMAADGTRADPSIEDWELDKLMHQMDPDHL